MPRVVHFEIHAEDPERAIRFYKTLFGWEFTKWAGPMDYWLIKTGPDEQPGINGGLMKRHGPGPTEGLPVIAYVCTVDVASVDQLLQQIPANGGSIALPKMPIPGIGWLAYGKDTEGNIFGFMQSDPSAA
jgi:predicted enzyme related to lactoylglutathione lyase